MRTSSIVVPLAGVLLGGVILVDARHDRGAGASERVHRVDGDDLVMLGVTAQPLHVVAGASVRLAVDVEHGRDAAGSLRYWWEAPAGRLQADDAAEVTWVAPRNPGRRRVRVTVEDGGNRVTGEVWIEVRLPSPLQAADLRATIDETRAEEQAAAADRAAEVDRRLAELQPVADAHESVSDLIAGQAALEEMAGLLAKAGRYQEAAAIWDRQLVNLLPGAKYADYQAQRGDVLFMLGDEDGALAAWTAGGDYTSSQSRYYQGQILERRGDRDGALAAYADAEGGMHWFGDPVYRQALLLLDGGADPDAVADMLVEASPRLDRERMLARFTQDPETAVLGRLLRDRGRIDDLVAQQPLHIEIGDPGAQAGVSQ